ncbi:MAG: OmpA family protein [Bacteroidales bacterium]|nr:OmpA family protein [Bacteroidales bacterium]
MKNLAIVTIIILSATATMAQRQNTFVELNAGYNIHDVNTKITDGKKGLGGGLALYGGFGHYFSEHWGITAGVKLITAKTNAKLDFSEPIGTLPDDQLLLDNKGKEVEVMFSNMKERTSETLLFLPVGLNYRYNFNPRLSFEGRLTAEPGFVLKQKYKTVSGDINLSNSYVNTFNGVDVVVENVTELEGHGAGSQGKFSGNADMKTMLFATGLSAGVVYALSDRWAITGSVYGTYTFTDQKNKDYPHVFDGETYVGTAQSKLCTKIHPYTVGVTVGVRMFVGRDKNKPEEIETIPEPEDEVAVTDEPELVVEPEKVDTVVVNNEPVYQPTDTLDIVEHKPTKEEVQKQLDEIGAINFDLGSTQNDDESAKIDRLAELIKANPDKKFLITGHTCNLGSLATNRTVGQKRADGLKAELIKRDVNPDQLKTESRWYKQPLVPNTSEANRKKNRRAEVEVL